MEESTYRGAQRPSAASATSRSDNGNDPVGLRAMLVGTPLLDARGVYAREALDVHLDTVATFLKNSYPIDDIDMETALREVASVRAMNSQTKAGLACKRALLLFAMYMESEVAEHFVTRGGADGRLATDLRARVLPKLVPTYVANMCQQPDVFVRMVSVMHEMWPLEAFGSQAAQPATHAGPAAPPYSQVRLTQT